MSFQKPSISKNAEGKFVCTYDNEGGSKTFLVADSYEQLCEKLSVAHQSACAALQRSRRAFETIKSQTLDQKTREADELLQEARRNAAVWEFKQNNPDYYPCQSSRDLLLQWISANQMDVTPESLQAAFEVNKERLAKPPQKPVLVPPVESTPAPAPAPKVQADPRLPSRDALLEMARNDRAEFAKTVRFFGSKTIDKILNEVA